MAKRRRLSPATLLTRQGTPLLDSKPGTKPSSITPPPIAQVSAEAAQSAALSELSDLVTEARDTGRLLDAIPVDAIEMHHLHRDRMGMYAEETNALKNSIRERGQTTAIEVTPLPDQPGRYGLISGYRRVIALQDLALEDRARFGTVKAHIIAPQDAQDAYIAMVEENEVRVDPSPYERAHVVVCALEAGVFPDQREALQTLYGNATRSKRSKIGALIPLVEALRDAVHYPAELSERQALALVKAIAEAPHIGGDLLSDLRLNPPQSSAEEAARFAAALRRAAGKSTLTKGSSASKASSRAAPAWAPQSPAPASVSYDAKTRVLQVSEADEGLFEAVNAFVRDYLATHGAGGK